MLMAAMFLYVCLVLLPATALATCDPAILPVFFDAIDSVKDDEIQRSEADAFYNKMNKDGDKCLTLADVKAQVPTVAPKLAGQEEPLYDIVDRDSNGCINTSDLDAVYVWMDINKDGAISRDEYDTALRVVCLPNTISNLGKGLGIKIG